MAWTWGEPVWPGLPRSWIIHAGWVHVVGNLVVLAVFAPALERYIGTWRMLAAVLAGNGLGMLAHVAAGGIHVAVLGASGAVYAVVAYSLVVGWHCPFELSRPRPRLLWPATLFHVLVLVEGLRWAAQVAAGHPPTSAAIHLGGIAAGVLLSGLLHRRWPGSPTSHRARGAGAVDPTVPLGSGPACPLPAAGSGAGAQRPPADRAGSRLAG
jgi:membrane associated rhomboid family serine protease